MYYRENIESWKLDETQDWNYNNHWEKLWQQIAKLCIAGSSTGLCKTCLHDTNV